MSVLTIPHCMNRRGQSEDFQSTDLEYGLHSDRCGLRDEALPLFLVAGQTSTSCQVYTRYL